MLNIYTSIGQGAVNNEIVMLIIIMKTCVNSNQLDIYVSYVWIVEREKIQVSISQEKAKDQQRGDLFIYVLSYKV